MIIIGEKINGTIPGVKKAIELKDDGVIRDLAKRQADAGANYIDICAGTSPEIEVSTLKWLMELVQDTVNIPLCIDSPNIRAIEQVLPFAKRPGIVNSVSEEGGKCEVMFPVIQGTDWQVIALTSDNNGIPRDVQTRVNITKIIVEKASRYQIPPEKIHIDPLVTALSTDSQSLLNFAQTVKAVKELFPTIKVTSGLSNISFGMPLRKIVNQHFYTLATYIGMDSAVMDPCSRDLMTSLLATEALLGRDRLCRKFANAYRDNRIGPIKADAK